MRLIIGIGARASLKPRQLGEPSAYLSTGPRCPVWSQGACYFLLRETGPVWRSTGEHDWRPVRDHRDRERVREAAELEGALQYPPASVGQDAQPSLPAKTVPQLVFPAAHRIGH